MRESAGPPSRRLLGSARVMRALGARDAVNLDGGGSTTTTVRGNVVTRPSDAAGERPIADAIVLLRDRH